MASSSPPGSAGDPHEGAARLTGEQISSINRFPDDNPNPVMRYDADGHLIYANPASVPILRAIGIVVGDRLPGELVARFDVVARTRGCTEFTWQSRTYAVWPVPIADLDFTNLYGTDVTAERAIVKFPDQNPNPVMRFGWDGVLVYANPASAGIVAGLGLATGEPLPAELRDALLDRVRAADRATVEIEAGGRSYALLPVDLPEFGFINVYGTDITAVRERERLARENERLLLNILPEPIAQRLRLGEPLIADRFDDVTVLFADIVDFTHLSSSMSAADLVGILNEVFSVFDGLVDRYDLEKVKTIGDAYMVVGGMSGDHEGHTARVAHLALDLADALESVDAVARAGIRFRIGIHCGPVVAGVIGTRKFIYDIWGDTVNLASRMESLGIPGQIQVTHAVMERLGPDFRFESRGLLDVKGKGPTPAYILVGRVAAATPSTEGSIPGTRPARRSSPAATQALPIVRQTEHDDQVPGANGGRSEMSRLLVHIATGPENPTRVALALLVARTALEAGHAVDVFIAGDGVAVLRPETLEAGQGIGTGGFREHVDALVTGGAKLYASGLSSKARGLTADSLGGLAVTMAAPARLVELAFEADRVISY